MGVDLSSKVAASMATVNRVTEAVTQSQAQVAKAVESTNPAAVTAAVTQATSQVTQAMKADRFQPAAKAPAAQGPWSSSFAAAAPSLAGKPVAQSLSRAVRVPATQAANTSAIKFTPQQTQEIGKKVGEAYANGTLPPPKFNRQQLNEIGKQVGNSINDSKNVVSDEDSKKSGFDKSSTVVQQSTDTDCGAAAVATVSSSKTDKSGKSAKDVESDLSKQYSSTEGATPKQVAQMLAHEGLEVTGSTEHLDHDALTASLKNGSKGLAMVDSNAINPSSKDQGTGKAHWVTVDGMDKEGNYQVKDPASGRSYYVSPEQLEKAMSTVRETQNSGGLITVKNAQGTKSEEQLAQQGTQDAGKLGDTPGKGSNWRKSYGSESS